MCFFFPGYVMRAIVTVSRYFVCTTRGVDFYCYALFRADARAAWHGRCSRFSPLIDAERIKNEY